MGKRRRRTNKKSPSGKRSGFTLIELLVVIAIIGTLSTVVLASVNQSRVKSRDAARISQLEEVRLAFNLYFDDNGSFPGSGGADRWYDTACIGTTPVGDDSESIPNFDTLPLAGYLNATPQSIGNVCLWYNVAAGGTEYRLMFWPEQPSLAGGGDGCGGTALPDYYCVGTEF